MANSKRFVVKNGLETQNIQFVELDGTETITLTVLEDGSLSFSGTSGQLFSITDSLTGSIFSVNDISGIPSIEVFDDGKIILAGSTGNVGIGVLTPTQKLDVAGNINISSGSKYKINGVDLSAADVGASASNHTHLLAAGATDVTATAAELNVLDGITATTAELNYTDGVTSNIQTQLNGTVKTTGNQNVGGEKTFTSRIITNDRVVIGDLASYDVPYISWGGSGDTYKLTIADYAYENPISIDTQNAKITAATLVSNVATGTSPLTVTSTTAVTNLNADLLDGNHASAFALASHSHAISDVTNLQTSLDNKVNTSALGAANGVATLDSNSKLNLSQLPIEALDSLKFYSTVSGDVSDLAKRQTLAAELADVYNLSIGSVVGTYFIINAAGTISDVTGIQVVSGDYTGTYVTLSFRNQDSSATQGNANSGALEIGDWFVIEQISGAGTLASPLVFVASVISNTYEDATTSIKGITQLSSSTSTATTGNNVITDGILNGLIGTASTQIAAGNHTHSTGYFNSSITSNLDTLYTTGQFGWNTGTTGRPEDFGQGINIVSAGTAHNNTNNWITQLGFGTSTTSSYFRTKVNTGAWTSWRKIWNEANDGSGSGLDADKVDNLEASQFIRSDEGDTAAGNHEFYATDTTGNYALAAVEIREAGLVNNAQTADAYAPKLAFHWGGITQTSIFLSANGNLYLNGGQNGKILTTADEGSGNGIDADTLDGLNSTDFVRRYSGNVSGISSAGFTTIATINAAGDLNSVIKFTLGGTTSGVVVAVTGEIITNHSHDYYIRTEAGNYTIVTLNVTGDDNGNYWLQAKTNNAASLTMRVEIETFSNDTVTIGTATPSGTTYSVEHICTPNQITISTRDGATLNDNQKVWTSGNDGSSSGLDADLLDGNHASAFALDNAVVKLTGDQTIAGTKTFSATIVGNQGINLNNSNIININNLTIGDPGPDEGINWAGGNLWKIYESPNDLTTNGAGNLQIVQNATRRATFNTSGQLELPITTGTAPLVIASTTAVTNLNADLLDGLHSTSFSRRFNLAGQVQTTDYRKSVIALTELTNTNPSADSYSFGKITFHRGNGLEAPVVLDIAMEKTYNVVGANYTAFVRSGNSFGDNIQYVKFQYNGVWYGGIEFYFSAARHDAVTFHGETNFAIFGLDYYNTQTSTVINSEVNSSITTADMAAESELFLNNRIVPVLTAGGNLGIGTTSPNSKIEISASDNSNHIRNSLLSAPTSYFLDLKQAVSPSIVKWNFSQRNNGTDYANVLVFDRGKVGIGLDTPTTNLDVLSSFEVTSAANANHGLLLEARSTYFDSTEKAGMWISDGSSSGAFAGQGAHLIIEGRKNASRDIYIKVGDTTSASHVFKASGNVGIGTTSPNNELHVVGSKAGNVVLKVQNTGGNTSADAMLLLSTSATLTSETVGVQLLADRTDTDANGSTDLQLRTSNGTTMNTNMIIKHNGNVGIGTTTPIGKLDIQGSRTTAYSSSAIVEDFFRIRNLNNGAGANQQAGISLSVSSDNGTSNGVVQLSAVAPTTGASTADFVIQTRNAGTTAERMRILANGNVGIGTTAAASLLSIGGQGETGALSVQGIAVNGNIANFRDFEGENIFTLSGTLTSNNFVAKIGDHTGIQNSTYIGIEDGPNKIYFMSDAAVGVGTTNPTAKLDVNGDVKHTGLTMTTGTNVDQTKSTTLTSALTTAWTDVTGVSGTYLATGSYIVQIESNGEYYTGNMTWFSGTTTTTVSDEITLHRAGPAASAARIFARVTRTSSAPSTLKLQVSASTTVSSHTLTFKFRRTI